MNIYEGLFADQTLDEVLSEADFPGGSRLDVARARMWEGRLVETANAAQGADEPWASFIVAHGRIQAGQDGRRQLRSIAEDADAQSRARLWAFTALRKLGERPSAVFAGEVLGVVVEVPVDGGLDVLAAYADGSCRYLSHADQLIAREVLGTPDPDVEAVLRHAHSLLAIAPAPRDPAADPPPPEKVRFTALSANGLHRVEVPWAEVEKGGRYEALFVATIALLQKVTSS